MVTASLTRLPWSVLPLDPVPPLSVNTYWLTREAQTAKAPGFPGLS
jgi:hypothetical protein